MNRARRYGVVVILIGLLGLTTVMRNPRFQNFHTVDILQLIASGACFGLGLMSLMMSGRKS
jgi:hypothetical protein